MVGLKFGIWLLRFWEKCWFWDGENSFSSCLCPFICCIPGFWVIIDTKPDWVWILWHWTRLYFLIYEQGLIIVLHRFIVKTEHINTCIAFQTEPDTDSIMFKELCYHSIVTAKEWLFIVLTIIQEHSWTLLLMSCFTPPCKSSSPGIFRTYCWLVRESEMKWKCSVRSNSFRSQGQYSPLNSPGQNIRVGSFSLLQGIFPTQESNRSLLHCRQILYQLSYQGTWKKKKKDLVEKTKFPGTPFMSQRQWQPTPVLLPGKSHGWRSLVGCSPWCP